MKNQVDEIAYLTTLITLISKELSPEGKRALSELITWFEDKLDDLKSIYA